MTQFPIGGTAYVRQPERKEEIRGLIVGKGDGMVRLGVCEWQKSFVFL